MEEKNCNKGSITQNKYMEGWDTKTFKNFYILNIVQ